MGPREKAVRDAIDQREDYTDTERRILRAQIAEARAEDLQTELDSLRSAASSAAPMDDVEPEGPNALDVVTAFTTGLLTCFSVHEVRLAIETLGENQDAWDQLERAQGDYAEHLPDHVTQAEKKPRKH